MYILESCPFTFYFLEKTANFSSLFRVHCNEVNRLFSREILFTPKSKSSYNLSPPDHKSNEKDSFSESSSAVSYTHLRAHETSLHLVCRLLLEKRAGDGSVALSAVFNDVVGVYRLFFQAEDGIRDVERSRGLGDLYKRQGNRLRVLFFET